MHYNKNDVDAIVKELIDTDIPKNETRYLNGCKVWNEVGSENKVDGTDYIISMPRVKGNASGYQLFLTLLTSKPQYEYLLFEYPKQNNYIFHMITEYKLCNTFKHGTSTPRNMNELTIKKQIYDEKKKRVTQYQNKK